jgi:hypothetical protein
VPSVTSVDLGGRAAGHLKTDWTASSTSWRRAARPSRGVDATWAATARLGRVDSASSVGHHRQGGGRGRSLGCTSPAHRQLLRLRKDGLLAGKLRVELCAGHAGERFGVFGGRFAEDVELDRVQQRHEATHEVTVAVRLHVGEVGG